MNWWERQFWTLANATKLVQTYTPTLTGSGTLAFSGMTVNAATYWKIPFVKLVWVCVELAFTIASGSGQAITVSLPLTAADAYQCFSVRLLDGTNVLAGTGGSTTTAVFIRKYDAANWVAATGQLARFSGLYRIA